MVLEEIYYIGLSYLSNRKQYVYLQGTDSKTESVTCGVPQWSILGPLLFIIYVNDISEVSNKIFPILFADDTTILMEGNSRFSPMMDTLMMDTVLTPLNWV